MPATYQVQPDTCCHCHQEGGLVWNVPGYANLWVHLACAADSQQQARRRAAVADLRTARHCGEMMIGQTQKGTVRLSYNQGDRTYTLDQMPTHTQNPHAVRLAQGHKSTVQPILMGLYRHEAK